jgi:uncharacterized membrane protein YqaE (UPF0057 family)
MNLSPVNINAKLVSCLLAGFYDIAFIIFSIFIPPLKIMFQLEYSSLLLNSMIFLFIFKPTMTYSI